MSSHSIDEDAVIIAAAAIAVVLVITFAAVVGNYVMRRTQHATDEENKPLLSNDEPITMYDNDTGSSIESMLSKPVRDVENKMLTNAPLSASPTTILSERAKTTGKAVKDHAAEQKTEVESSIPQTSPTFPMSLSPVLPTALRDTSGPPIQAKPIERQHEILPDKTVSHTRSGMDGAADGVENVGKSIDRLNGRPSSSFLDSFMPQQGLVEAMKAKIKGSVIPEKSKEASILAEVSAKLIDVANENAQAIKIHTISDEANDPTESTIYNVNLGHHTVAPPGAFPTSPKEAAKGKPCERSNEPQGDSANHAAGAATTSKQPLKTTGSKLPKRRRQASKNEETPRDSLPSSRDPKIVANPANKTRAVGSTYAQIAKNEQARRSSAPGPENSSNGGGNSMSKSQRRRHTRKKSNSVAAAMPPVDEAARAPKV